MSRNLSYCYKFSNVLTNSLIHLIFFSSKNTITVYSQPVKVLHTFSVFLLFDVSTHVKINHFNCSSTLFSSYLSTQQSLTLKHGNIFIYFSETLRNGFPTKKKIHWLHRNALVSLSDDDISREKVAINLHRNPHATFLCPSNATASTINSHVLDVLFEKDRPMRHLINAHRGPMLIFQNMTVVVTENK